MAYRISLIIFIAFLISAVTTSPSDAQSVIIPPGQISTSSMPLSGLPVAIQSENVDIKIDDQFAQIECTLVLRNQTNIDLEGAYIFPIPLNADISNFMLYLDGKPLTAEILEAAKAESIYRDIVRRMRDPGLLQYIGQGMVQAQVYPIPAMGTKEIKITYSQLLSKDNDYQKLVFPLKLEGFSSSSIGTLTIKVEITVPDKLGLIYSPSHSIEVNRHGPCKAVLGYEATNIRPQGDFTLLIGRPEGRVGVNLITHATGQDEGYFITAISPEYKEPEGQEVAKDFIFLLDKSGSMAGNKIEQAKKALEFIFRNLNKGDRYSLVTFATEVAPFRSGWKDYDPGNEGDVIDFIRSLKGDGMTFIEGAFNKVFELQSRSDVPCYVIFLTDGLPTIGETDTAKLIQQATKLNYGDRRIFGFGVGWDVDYQFLDSLARDNGGYTTSVKPDEDMEAPLADFYSKIKSPVMTDIKINFDGVDVYDIYPRNLPDLFLGGQIILAGRYRHGGSGCFYISGRIDGEWREFEFPLYFEKSTNDYVPRLWANRKVGYLLNEIRLNGENKELQDEIIKLAKKYGIVTPYTSMLVVEDGDFINMGQANAFRSRNNLPSGSFSPYSSTFNQGAHAQSASIAMQSQEGIENLDKSFDDEVTTDIRYAGDKTFYLDEDGFWVDGDYDPDEMTAEEVEYLSDAYFDLADNNPRLARYLSVGENVIVVYEGSAYKIVDD